MKNFEKQGGNFGNSQKFDKSVSKFRWLKNNGRNSGNLHFQIYIIEKYSEESLTNERLFIIGIMNLDMEMKFINRFSVKLRFQVLIREWKWLIIAKLSHGFCLHECIEICTW